jgi:hypothetical protein
MRTYTLLVILICSFCRLSVAQVPSASRRSGDCVVPNYRVLSPKKQELLDSLRVDPARWDALENNKDRLGFLNVTGAVIVVPLEFEGLEIDWQLASPSIRQDRIFLTNADQFYITAIVHGSKFSCDIGGGGSHPGYPDSHRHNVFHKSLQLSFSHNRIKGLEADVDIFNPNPKGGYGLGLLLHSFEVLLHTLGRTFGGSGRTNPYNVAFRSNWECLNSKR